MYRRVDSIEVKLGHHVEVPAPAPAPAPDLEAAPDELGDSTVSGSVTVF